MREFWTQLRIMGRAIAWCWGAGRGGFAFGVLCLAASKVLQTVALFLPIKILLVLASGGSSPYLQLIPVDPDILLFGLAGAIPLLYAGSILCASGHRRVVDAARPNAPAPFQNPPKDKKFTGLYEACLSITSNVSIVVVGIAVSSLMNLMMGSALFGLLSVFGLVAIVAIMPMPHGAPSWGNLRPSQIMEYANVFGFFAAFVVISFLVVGRYIDVYGAVLTLLMSRVMFRSAKDIFNAFHRRRSLDLKQLI